MRYLLRKIINCSRQNSLTVFLRQTDNVLPWESCDCRWCCRHRWSHRKSFQSGSWPASRADPAPRRTRPRSFSPGSTSHPPWLNYRVLFPDEFVFFLRFCLQKQSKKLFFTCNMTRFSFSIKWRQQFHPAVTRDTNIIQPSVPSYSRVKLLPSLYNFPFKKQTGKVAAGIYCVVPRRSMYFWTHPEIIPVGQFFRRWIKSINQTWTSL